MTNIYLVERTDEVNYDEYISFVCYAKDDDEARAMKPYRKDDKYYEYYEKCRRWPCNPDTLTVKWIGDTQYEEGVEIGPIHASYRHG